MRDHDDQLVDDHNVHNVDNIEHDNVDNTVDDDDNTVDDDDDFDDFDNVDDDFVDNTVDLSSGDGRPRHNSAGNRAPHVPPVVPGSNFGRTNRGSIDCVGSSADFDCCGTGRPRGARCSGDECQERALDRFHRCSNLVDTHGGHRLPSAWRRSLRPLSSGRPPDPMSVPTSHPQHSGFVGR